MRRLRWLGLIAIAALVAAGVLLARVLDSLPDLRALEDHRPALPTRVVDRHGEPIGEFASIRRQLVRLADVPRPVVAAFLAAEDADFYRHGGLDLPALARAAWTNLRAGGVRQGGSTITQQLAKSLLGGSRTLDRKMRDMLLALRIESRLSKDAILEIYLNDIYLGNGAYGVAQAARSYFDKRLDELTLSEAALIAGLTKAPSAYAPSVDPDAAETRRLYVLDRMRELGEIDEPAWRAARGERPALRAPSNPEAFADAAWFVEEVRRTLQPRLGASLTTGGLVVETTLDLALQRAAVSALREGVAKLDRRSRRGAREGAPEPSPLEGALVALDVATGEVRALVGGTDYATSQFNRATQARRQPGSAFKPFVYGAALEAGWRPDGTVYDVQVSLRDPKRGRRWTPRNAGALRGAVPIHEAVSRSLNNATVRLLIEVGVERAVDFARRAGIRSPLAEDLGLALGTSGVTPLELTNAYRSFADAGRARAPRLIRRVLDRDGAVVFEEAAVEAQAIAPVDAYLLTHVLRGPVRNPYGTAYAAAALKRPLAGKTGSTNEHRDAWFVGYSPALAAGVWVGRDRMEPLGRNATGTRAALPIWIDFMETALEAETRDANANDAFAIPDGVEWTWRDPKTGALQRTRRAIAGFVPNAAGRPVRRSKVVAVPKPPAPKPSAPAVAAAAAGASVPWAPLLDPSRDWLPPVGAAPPLAP